MPLPTAIIAGLSLTIVPLVVKVLTALGIGFVTYTGADFILTEGKNYILANYNSMPAEMLAILTKAGFLQGLNILFAAWAAAIAVKVTMGAFTKLRFGGA